MEGRLVATVRGVNSAPVAEAFGRALRGVIEQCRHGDGGFTPSDFGLAGLDQGALDSLLDRLGGLKL